MLKYLAILLLELALIGYVLLSSGANGYLPSPFFYESADTFMDFYNPNYWANNDGRYYYWGSIYPPINFIIGRVLNSGCDWATSSYTLRECGGQPYILLCSLMLGCLFLYKIVSERNGNFFGILITVIVALSFPALYAYERGNFILFAFAFLSIYVSSTDLIIKSICMGIAINFKPYLIVCLIPMLVFKKYNLLIYTLGSTSFVYTLTYLWLGDGSILDIIQNILNFNSNIYYSAFEKLWYTTSINSYIKVLGTHKFLLNTFTANGLDLIIYLLNSVRLLALLMLLFCTKVAIFDKRNTEESFNIYSLLLFITFIFCTESPGGYSAILVFPLLVSCISYNKHFSFYLTMLILSISFPFFNIMPQYLNSYSYISGVNRFAYEGLPIYSLMLPFLLLALILFNFYTYITYEKKP